MTHIPARTHTHGESFCRLPDTCGHSFMFGVFWHGITHGRSRLRRKPAHWGTLETCSYLTSAMFFRLVMTGQLLEAKWGRAQRQNKSPHFSPDCQDIHWSIYEQNKNPSFTLTSSCICARRHILCRGRQFLVKGWWQSLWFIQCRTASEQRLDLHTDTKRCKSRDVRDIPDTFSCSVWHQSCTTLGFAPLCLELKCSAWSDNAFSSFPRHLFATFRENYQ